MTGMSRSTYYHRPKDRTEKLKQDADLRDRIERILLRFPYYGSRRVTEQLRREGKLVNHKRVERVMKQDGLCARRPRKRFKVTTDSRHPYPVYPNLAKGFKPTGPDHLWVCDLTYIRVLTAFVYLAVILDAFSRKVVGYALSRRLDVELTLGALRAAVASRRPSPGCIHHSDRGVQYAATDYVEVLKGHGFRISMSRKGNVYDNAMAEAFFKTLKAEEVYLWEYRDWEDVATRLPEFIERVYNGQRIHSALGYITPEEFESQYELTEMKLAS